MGYLLKILIINLREKEKKRTLICCFTYLCSDWLILVWALARDQTHNSETLTHRTTCPGLRVIFFTGQNYACFYQTKIHKLTWTFNQ